MSTATSEPDVISQPDMVLVELNQAIKVALLPYIDKVNLVFGLPDPTKLPAVPTVSVFLYDVHEDLELRSGQSRQYDPASGRLRPGRVHICCCYLLTYWDSISDETLTTPDYQGTKIMGKVLCGLVNTREFSALQESFTRVISPSEHLSSLGNFWQSLGNKPRLCLNYSVTVPLELDDSKETSTSAITSLKADLTPKTPDEIVQAGAGDVLLDAPVVLWQMLCDALGGSTDEARQKLAHVVIRCKDSDTLVNSTGRNVDITLSGVSMRRVVERIKEITTEWMEASLPVCTIDDVEIFVKKVDTYLLGAALTQ